MKKILPLLSLTACPLFALAQTPCSIQGFANPAQITCGQTATLSAFGNGSGNVAFQENFNSGSPQGWQFTQAVTIGNNTCGVPSPDGSNFMWMGDASVNPRDMTTVPFDLTLGGTVCFDMRYAVQADASPCEGPDEPDEGVYLQYSTDNGATWNTINYFDPDGGYNNTLTSWNQYCFVIPPGAQTAATMIRWHQDDVSGAEYDHWGIDNITITLNDPNYIITWPHDGYSYGFGSSGGNNPNLVSPQTTTTYTVQISDGTNTCTDQVTVTVVDPVIIVDAGPDLQLCPGDCADLQGTAYWQIAPAGTPTFENNEFELITGTPAIPGLPPFLPPTPGTLGADININVGGLNMTNVEPGSIAQVCVNGFNIINGSTLANTSVILTCPGGSSITLVPINTMAGSAMTNVCFVPAAPAINTGSAPYTGNWNPSQPFDNLVGCQANGLWELSVGGEHSNLTIPLGTLTGWSITFNDPELIGPVNFTWDPTVNMTGSNTLTPNICPNFTTTYTLTATSAPGCLPASDEVTVTVPNTCCQLQLDDVIIQQPSCAGGDGSIEIITSASITGLLFSIDNGVTFQASNIFTGLNTGTYFVLVNDDNDCPVGMMVELVNDDAPVIDNLVPVNSSCSGNTGSITVTASGGSGALQYSIDNGVTNQAGNVFSNLAAGNYTVTVTDALGCSSTAQTVVGSPGSLTLDNIIITAPNCGAQDGTLEILATGNGLEFSIDNGLTFQASNIFTNLGAGAYTIIVRDNAGCTVTQNENINDAGAPVINAVNATSIACGSGTGSISIDATGLNLQYSIDNGVSFQASPNFVGLGAGNYAIVVDQNGCEASAQVEITETPGLIVQAITENDGCAPGCSGSINVVVQGGTLPYTYAWSGGAGVNSSQSNPLCAGTYTVNVTDVNGCAGNVSSTISSSPGVFAEFTFTPDLVLLPNGLVNFTSTSSGADTYAWSFGALGSSDLENPFFDFSTAAPGTYEVCLTASNAEGCSDVQCEFITIKENFNLFVPNAFSPNANNMNDAFFPVPSKILSGAEFDFTIYSRWGELIFSSADSNVGWDGTNRGKPVPPDVYVWRLKLNVESLPEQQLIGHVMLIR